MGRTKKLLPYDLPNWRIIRSILKYIQSLLPDSRVSDEKIGCYMQVLYDFFHSEKPNIKSDKDFEEAVQYKCKRKVDNLCVWYGVLKFFKKISVHEKEQFLRQTLPGIIQLAIDGENHKEDLFMSVQQEASSQKLSRGFVTSLVASSFLCLIPEEQDKLGRRTRVNFKSFYQHLPFPSQVAKMKCVLCYFEEVIANPPVGQITFTRKNLKHELLATKETLLQSTLPLCPLEIKKSGLIEDSDANTIRVDFANKSIGGGVLGKGSVQEEIMFSICPELISSMLFMEMMQENESISISGYEQFCFYSGYADSFKFTGLKCDRSPQTLIAIDAVSYRHGGPERQYEDVALLRDFNKALIGFSNTPPHFSYSNHSDTVIKEMDLSSHANKNSWTEPHTSNVEEKIVDQNSTDVAIDKNEEVENATDSSESTDKTQDELVVEDMADGVKRKEMKLSPKEMQQLEECSSKGARPKVVFESQSVEQEDNTENPRILAEFPSYDRPIATGNWGCGAYRGDAQVKLTLQWIAASLSGCPSLIYYTFQDGRLEQADEMIERNKLLTVGELSRKMWKYCSSTSLHLASAEQKSRVKGATKFRQRVPHHVWQEELKSLLPETLFEFLLARE